MAKLVLDANGQVPRATLYLWLADLEEALQRVLSGQQITASQYSSLGGGMSTTRQAVSADQIRARMAEIRQQLGLAAQRRRAIGIRFG